MQKIATFALLCAAAIPVTAFSQSMPAWKSYTQTGNTADIVPSAGSDNSVAAWIGKKVDINNGTATGLNLINGTATGTNISAAYADSRNNTVSSYLTPKTSRPRYIFFGGADNFASAANLSPALINSGKVGLYEHANGVAPLTDAERAAIQAAFAVTGSNLVNGGGDAMGEIGLTTDAQYVGYFNGKYPIEDNTNIYGAGTYTESDGTVYQAYYTADQLAEFESGFDSVIPLGVKNVAPVVTPNSFDAAAIGTDFSTDPYWANTRTAALYGGAIALDTPPSYATWQGTAYLDTVISEIKWGLANHLRVTIILAPFNGSKISYPDPELWNNAARFLDDLIRAGAIPTSYVVETYCGCTTNTPLVGSSDLNGSMDHLVSMLLTAPVSAPGTALPQSSVAGTLSEANAFSAISINHTVDSMNTSSTYQGVLADINNNAYGTNIIGSLGYQSADNAFIQSGKIGSSNYGPSSIDVFLSSTSSFTTQTPLTFQGTNGNPQIQGGGDANLHLTDPFISTENDVGLTFGAKTTAASISNDGTDRLILNAPNNILVNDSFIFQGVTSSLGNAQVGMVADSGLLNISNPYSTDKAQTGISFGSNTNAPAISLDASGGNLIIQNAAVSLNQALLMGAGINLYNLDKASIIAITTAADGAIMNDQTDHVPVISEGGKWYPLQLGTALSN